MAFERSLPGSAGLGGVGLTKPAAPARPGLPTARPGAKTVKVLVVDDSALMRQAVTRVLSEDPGIEVVDTARDGMDALLKVERLMPDVVTMDVEMPGLDGLSALRMLMERFPRPVVMFSSLTSAGANATVKALALGAVDFLCKPNGSSGAGLSSVADELRGKVKHASVMRVRRPLAALKHVDDDPPKGTTAVRTPAPAAPAKPAAFQPAFPPRITTGSSRPSGDRLLIIGSSTGGPRALAEVVAGLPSELGCPAVIVQHLPAGFTSSLAARLDQLTELTVAEARAGEMLLNNRILIAPGDFHLRIVGHRVELEMSPRRHGVRPSVDITLETAVESYGPAVLTAILTGMGEDGCEGARAVKAAGGLVLAEHESTCVVYGMPRAVVEAGLADQVVPLDEMAHAIQRTLPRLQTRAARRVAHVG